MCPYEERLTAWLLGDLSEAERKEMDAHVRVCAECAAEVHELKAVLSPLKNGLEKDARLTAKSRTLVLAPRFGIWMRRAALLAISGGAFFCLLGYLYKRANPPRDPDETVTTLVFKKEAAPPAALQKAAGFVTQKPQLETPEIEAVPLGDVSAPIEPSLPLVAYGMPEFAKLVWFPQPAVTSVHERLLAELPEAEHEKKVRGQKHIPQNNRYDPRQPITIQPIKDAASPAK
jgi:hypothetical protein